MKNGIACWLLVLVVLDIAADLMTDHHITRTHPCMLHATASDVLNAMREGSLGIEVSETTKKNIECCEHCDTSTLSALGAATRVMSPKSGRGDATGVPETCWTGSTGIKEEIRDTRRDP